MTPRERIEAIKANAAWYHMPLCRCTEDNESYCCHGVCIEETYCPVCDFKPEGRGREQA